MDYVSPTIDSVAVEDLLSRLGPVRAGCYRGADEDEEFEGKHLGKGRGRH